MFLNAIADEIDARGDAISEKGMQEAGLPAARLTFRWRFLRPVIYQNFPDALWSETF